MSGWCGVENGAWSPALQERLTALETHKRLTIETRLSVPEPTDVVEIRPAAAETYQSRVIDFTAALSDVDNRAAASEALRSLIDKIVMAPDRHVIELYGDLAVTLKLGTALTSKRLSVSTSAAAETQV